jgi:hypothetical protein
VLPVTTTSPRPLDFDAIEAIGARADRVIAAYREP